jgi:hypothetical protein
MAPRTLHAIALAEHVVQHVGTARCIRACVADDAIEAEQALIGSLSNQRSRYSAADATA